MAEIAFKVINLTQTNEKNTDHDNQSARSIEILLLQPAKIMQLNRCPEGQLKWVKIENGIWNLFQIPSLRRSDRR